MIRKKGFTLVELLVVISIIIVLIGLATAGVRQAMKKAKTQKAKTEIISLLTAINRFYSETGIYPLNASDKADISLDKIGKGLTKEAVYGKGDNTVDVFGPYYEFKDSNSADIGSKRMPVDPWGNQYFAYIPPDSASANSSFGSEAERAVNNGFVVVASKGPDGTSPSNDDIGSWQ